MKSVDLSKIVKFACDFLESDSYSDFEGARNGLQFANSGRVHKIAASVDAGLFEMSEAAKRGADLLLVHHGMFWDSPKPFVGPNYLKVKTLLENDIAVLSMHLPLDGNRELGNNAVMAKKLGMKISGYCLPCGGKDRGVLADIPKGGRPDLERRLKKLFPDTFKAIPFGSASPARAVLCSGSCGDAVELLPSLGVDTLVCGELRQHHYVAARDLKLNLYPCGHYATETFGVCALAEKISGKFKLEWEFIETQNPL